MDKELYDKYLVAMRKAYQAMSEDVDDETFNDDEVMEEITMDADRMRIYGNLTKEEMNYFYDKVSKKIKKEIFHKIRKG